MNARLLVRITVASDTRRVDLVLPGAVPVAELVPELARSVGMLDPATLQGGYRLVTLGGRVLAGDSGLVRQGIEDGGLLTVTAGADHVPPRVYDDVAEAMAHCVEGDLEHWQPASGRRAALIAATLMMALGALALSLQEATYVSAVATVVALILTAGAVVVSRVRGEVEAAVAMAWMGASFAAVTAFTLAPEGPFFGYPMAYAGAAAATVGLAGLVGLGKGRLLMIPVPVSGTILLATGLVMRAATFEPAVVLTTVMTLVVLAGTTFPWLALGATSTKVQQLRSIQDMAVDPDDIDLDRVRADAQVAHQILLALSATSGLILASVVPLAVSLGLSGTLLAAGSCLVVILRTRQHCVRQQVLVGVVSGIAGMSSIAISVLFLHPGWRPVVTVALVVTGAALLAGTLAPPPASARWGRAGDLAETAGLLALLPLFVVATGIFTAVRG